MTIFYIPCSSEQEATHLANLCLENHIAACANIHPCDSIFFWKNEMQNEKEWVLSLKTFPEFIPDVENLISQNHSYDVPGILSWNASCNDAYAQWMRDILKNN